MKPTQVAFAVATLYGRTAVQFHCEFGVYVRSGGPMKYLKVPK